MSVHIKYKGRIGNHFFQYAYARLLAERNNMKLTSDWEYKKLIRATKPMPGRVFKEPSIYIKDTLPFDQEYVENYKLDKLLDTPLDNARYVIAGYFENSEIMNNNEEKIKRFFKLPKIQKSNPKDILINVRIGNDFAEIGQIIHPDYYLNILNNEQFEKVYIVGLNKEEKYLDFFKGINYQMLPSSPINDFYYFQKFDKIVCSNSTFSWWAAFFSDANTIYFPTTITSPFLKSCKDSIVVETSCLENYESNTVYNIKPLQKKKYVEVFKKRIKNIIGR